MEIWHRITFGHKDNVDAVLGLLNIEHKRSPLPGGGYLIHIDMAESDPRWPQLEALVREKNALDICNSVFTESEVLDAEWVRLVLTFEQGYPQPEEDMAWAGRTYEGKCPRCGAGYRQKAPFRLAQEPRLGRRDFLCLYWTYTFFTTPRVLAALEEHGIRGYEVWPALLHHSGKPSEVVAQLLFPQVAAAGLAEEDKAGPETCPACGRSKYRPHLRGYMHIARSALPGDTDVVQTSEWFGSGHAAYREVLISNRFARLVLEEGWRGVALKPVRLF